MAIDVDWNALPGKLAGLAGAVVSMRFLQGSLIARSTMALGGAAISFYASPTMALKTGLPEGLSGFLLGLFGMAIVSRMWEWIQATPINEVWTIFGDTLKRLLGTPPK